MTTNFHTPITIGAPANAATVNAPLAQLDSAIAGLATNTALLDYVLSTGGPITQANGAASAAQKVVTVDSTTGFLGGCFVEYALATGVIERNTVATVDSGTQLTLTTNIGTGGIANNALIAVIPTGTYNATRRVYNVLDYGASESASAATNKAAIQAALTACAAGSFADNGRVVIPAGYYNCEVGLSIANAFTTLEGIGGFAFLNMSGTGDFLSITAEGVSVKNVYLAGDHANAGNGISTEDAYWLRLENVRVYYAQYHTLYTNDTWWVTIMDCLFSAEDSDAGYSACYHDANSNAILHLRNRYISPTQGWGVTVVAGSGVTIQTCDFAGIADDSNGLYLRDVFPAVVIGSYFEHIKGTMIQLGNATERPANVNIIGSYFLFDDLATNIAIDVQGVSCCNITGNMFSDLLSVNPIALKIAYSNHLIKGLIFAADNQYDGCSIQNLAQRGTIRGGRTETYAAAVPYNGYYYNVGDVVWNTDADAGDPMGWICYNDGNSARAWVTGTVYATYDWCYCSNGKLYYTVAGGTSGATEPSHVTGSASDGAVTWVYGGEHLGVSQWQTMPRMGGIRFGSASPDETVTPYYRGELYLDVSAHKVYIAETTENTDWLVLN